MSLFTLILALEISGGAIGDNPTVANCWRKSGGEGQK
jgi:hypothetical protein